MKIITENSGMACCIQLRRIMRRSASASCVLKSSEQYWYYQCGLWNERTVYGLSSSDWAMMIETSSWRPVRVLIEGSEVSKRTNNMNSSASTSTRTCLTCLTSASSSSLPTTFSTISEGIFTTRNLMARLRTSLNILTMSMVLGVTMTQSDIYCI